MRILETSSSFDKDFCRDFVLKHRKILLWSLFFLICFFALMLFFKIHSMQKQIKTLLKYKPIYIVGVNRDINVGEALELKDFKALLFYEEESKTIPSLFSCEIDKASGQIFGIGPLIGRIAKIPIYKNSLLREEYLAPKDSLAGLGSLLDPGYTSLDIEVPQTGFHVFIKPGDFLNLYDLASSQILAHKAKVLLVDSKPLGKADWQVASDTQAKRIITLALPQTLITKILALKSKNLLALNYPSDTNKNETTMQLPKIYKSINNFQPLTLIKGEHKEINNG